MKFSLTLLWNNIDNAVHDVYVYHSMPQRQPMYYTRQRQYRLCFRNAAFLLASRGIVTVPRLRDTGF